MKAVPRLRAKLAFLVLTLVCSASCSNESSELALSKNRKHRDTVAAERVEFMLIADWLEAGDNEWLGRRRLSQIEKQLDRPYLSDESRSALQFELVPHLLRMGRNVEAFEMLQEVMAWHDKQGVPQPPELMRMSAIVNLRMAEQQNCVSGNCEQSCIFPLERGGVHKRRAPAERARDDLLRYLATNPADTPDVAWLLNIVNMTLGTFPDGVPEEYRISPKRWASDYDVGRFVDVSLKAKLKTLNLAGGVVVDDFDGDGYLDLFTTTMDPRGNARLYRNQGDGTFEDRSDAAGLVNQLGGLNCVAGDYDNDGDTDVMILRGGWILGRYGCIRRSLMRNNGDLTFTDVTKQAGLAAPAYPSNSAAWGDYDNDGDLDIYIANESVQGMGVEGLPDDIYPAQLFRNNGDETFTDIAEEAGVTNDLYAKGVAAGDYDNDGDLDLYVSNYSFQESLGRNRLYRNDGNMRFTDVAEKLGVQDAKKNFATWFFDYDNDGWLDIYCTGYDAKIANIANDYFGRPHGATPPRLFHNEKGKGFVDRAIEAGLDHAWAPMGSSFGDLDNDGYLDMYFGTGNPYYETLDPSVMLRNDGGKRFQDVTLSARVGHLQKGHGIAFCDLDNDGDQDLFAKLGGAFPGDVFGNSLFANPGHGNHFLKVKLVGTESNRTAIGARLSVEFEEPSGVRSIHRAVGSISSFGSTPLRQELGLGAATRIVRLEVFWPTTGKRQVFEDVPLDTAIRIVEGKPELEQIELKQFAFPPSTETPPQQASTATRELSSAAP